jgi:hypothetical protein
MKTLKIILISVFAIGMLAYLFGGGIEKQAQHEMQKIENQVAQDAIKQYEIALKGGDKMEIYVHAGMVTAAFLQAKDEANYLKWKEIERKAAKAAGL